MSETLTNGVIVPDKGSRDWYADLRSNWLKLDSLMAGGNITINPAQTEGVLVATITVGGKEYKLYQQDGDVSVKIDPSAENAEYPLVASTSAGANTGSVVMAPAVTVNPSTGAVTATSFKGKLDGNASTATNATKAVQDGAGAVITDTYATKKELGSKANDSDVVHKSGNETIAGTKTFSNVIHSNKELAYKDTKYDWANTSLDTWCDAGHVSWSDKTGSRRMHELVGTKGGVWHKSCYINENPYFSVDSNRNIIYWGTTFTWNGKVIATDDNVVHKSGNETINGLKTFSHWQIINMGLSVKWITGNKEQKALYLFGSMNDKYEGFGSELQLHGDDAEYGKFFLIAKDKTNTNVKLFIGSPDGTLTWNNTNILTDANRIMLAKNLSGTSIKPGGFVDCGNGNGNLKQWYLGADGTFVLANTLPTGIWKSTSFVTLAPNEGGIFIKLR